MGSLKTGMKFNKKWTEPQLSSSYGGTVFEPWFI